MKLQKQLFNEIEELDKKKYQALLKYVKDLTKSKKN